MKKIRTTQEEKLFKIACLIKAINYRIRHWRRMHPPVGRDFKAARILRQNTYEPMMDARKKLTGKYKTTKAAC